MKIVRHLLHHDDGTQIKYQRSPNRGGNLSPEFLIMHYTAGASAESSIAHMLKPAAKASAHLVIGRDGAITQLVPFNKVAWHAGRSRWHGTEGLNQYSIGIELDNAGKLTQQGGQWTSWFGRAYPDEQVLSAAHKHDGAIFGWQTYAEAQLTAAADVALAIAARYELAEVLGHDDIAPNRKKDPGPAFPMESFRAGILGRNADAPHRFVTRSRLNIRNGPGLEFDRLQEDPLPRGSQLLLQSRESNWCYVEVLDDDDEPFLTGWVHGDYIVAFG
ncbi:MAG: N-acetylmuramoyl-L-alanine amidase [Rhodospirillaceae bacterium]|jgi:N-acetylmuramoyl-L-alanine amidase|nr:N-acetylmuramoyl-L-alanine amidase [Rhodospirillaceae bacterium]MBT5193072.1 N-acetylmuramoyl-L-alanine amidase [Rhodospirillaceae bacterium]MBT5898680.1 N-acetylmuramoyl-L-alanine amidase [Rhodospirillaceae bacterium]MBT6427157.1 N-acetylmuramoyl-L-alanine amidase [Rhodospirillaceae bacterium]MBT7759707.1 N-acetylmuramoyl-L-alanine amidase [Rhodospirillaceae bacterium]